MAATETALTGSDLAFAGVARQAELIRTGQITSRELTELYLDRIFRLDQKLNAFRVVFAEQALAEASQADARRAAGDERPLLGVPIAIKDDQDVAGEPTYYGANQPFTPAVADAEIVARLRSAGAVIIGKTNVPELMTMPFTESLSYGATRNPWAIARTPGGSSGGSASAVAAGLVGAATASDGAGSIRIPAACAGLFGIKPEHGRVPRTPHRSDWCGLSVFGFVTRSVEDSALLYDCVKDGGPSWAEAARQEPGTLRIAMSSKVPPPIMAKPDRHALGALNSMAQRLRDLGHEVVERDPDFGRVIAGVVARYLRGIHEEAQAVPDPSKLAPRTKGLARMGAAIPPSAVEKARAAAEADSRRSNAFFEEGFDFLRTPMFTRLPLEIGAFEGRGGFRSFDGAAKFTPYSGIANHTGQPAMSVPAGSTPDGVPLAVQFLGPHDGEPQLLALASQLEAAIGWPKHRPPLAA